MTEADYTRFCSFAHDLQQVARSYFSRMEVEHARQLNGIVQAEIAAAGGKVAPAYDFLATTLAEEVSFRAQPDNAEGEAV